MLKFITGKDQKAEPILVGGQPIILKAGATIYTDAVSWPDHDDLALSVRAKSAGIPNITILMEECFRNPKENEEDEASIPSGDPIVEGLIDTNWHNYLLNPLPVKCFRFKVIENSTTAPDSELELILSCK